MICCVCFAVDEDILEATVILAIEKICLAERGSAGRGWLGCAAAQQHDEFRPVRSWIEENRNYMHSEKGKFMFGTAGVVEPERFSYRYFCVELTVETLRCPSEGQKSEEVISWHRMLSVLLRN